MNRARRARGMAVKAACLTLWMLSTAAAQVPVSENFDDYDSDVGIIGQGNWEGWDGAPPSDGFAPDTLVTEDQALSEPNSLVLQPAADVVYVLQGIASGQYVAKAMTYMPSTMIGNAFFILLNTYSHGGTKNWSTQVTFNTTTVASAGGTDIARSGQLPAITDEWVEIKVLIDLDAGTQEIYYGGEILDTSHAWQVSGVNEIQCIDLYSETADAFYYDDVAIQEQCDIVAVAEPSRGSAPLEVSFDASASACPDTAITAYAWDFGDGMTGSGAKVSHTYTELGVYDVQLEITDDQGATDGTTISVGVGCDPGDITPWKLDDVGEPPTPGCVSVGDGGCIDFLATGVGLGSREDELNYLYQEVAGDFSAVVRVDAVEWPNDARLGILARESLEPTSRLAFSAARNQTVGVRPRMERRRTVEGTMTGVSKTPEQPWGAPNIWLRLDREGEIFTAHWSPDGTAWEEIGNATLSEPAQTFLVGLGASSRGATDSVDARYCGFTISAVEPPSGNFRRGDPDNSGGGNITDAIAVLNHLFAGEAPPVCFEAADVNDDAAVNIADPVYHLNFLFGGGPAPAPPGGADGTECGPDPDPAASLGCEEYTTC